MAFSVFLLENTQNARDMPPRIPHAAHRHASPSGPWPWADLVEDDRSTFFLRGLDSQNTQEPFDAGSRVDSWRGYPTTLFPNWNRRPLFRSGISKVINRKTESGDADCTIYRANVGRGGQFSHPQAYTVKQGKENEFWDMLKQEDHEESRVEVLFVENLSGSVLQMLGTKYNIEPFFFSSSLNWIPSRHQQYVKQNQVDHITITLTFLKAMPNPMTASNTTTDSPFFAQITSQAKTATLDPQAPLILSSDNRILLPDILSFHMIRRKNGSTIISYHSTPEWKSTSAQCLHSRARDAGESVYWQSLFRRSEDPTLVLLCLLWYALYAWDESLDILDAHILSLESRVLVIPLNDNTTTQDMYIIRASLLHYASLLDNFRKAVLFAQTTPNPAMGEHADGDESTRLMKRECDTMLSDIERLEMFRKMQEMRLENMMKLAFATVNLENSRQTQRLSEAALRDSAAMKQISYLTMVFLPASFVASIFGMNIRNLTNGATGTLAHYFAVAFPLTAFTIWVVVALHEPPNAEESKRGVLYHLQWPMRSAKHYLKMKSRSARVFSLKVQDTGCGALIRISLVGGDGPPLPIH